jgi:DNA-binding NtrC family response regulator
MRSTQIPEQSRHVTFEPAAIERLRAQDWGENLYALERVVVAAVGESKGGAVREANLARPLRSLNAK